MMDSMVRVNVFVSLCLMGSIVIRAFRALEDIHSVRVSVSGMASDVIFVRWGMIVVRGLWSRVRWAGIKRVRRMVIPSVILAYRDSLVIR